MMRREFSRKGWVIYSAGRLWDDWVYPGEAAARATVERCVVPDATVMQDRRQGVVDKRGRQFSERLLYDRRRG